MEPPLIFPVVTRSQSSLARSKSHHMESLEEEDEEEPSRGSDDVRVEDRLTLSWTGISVATATHACARHPPPPTTILADVDGICRTGSLMALMGASGAGKTTLLNTLNFRNPGGLAITGDIMLNGHKVSSKDMAKISAFVQQEDIFIGTLKVKEHLMFHATLRMKDASTARRKARVEEIMHEMGLKRCEGVIIGIPGRVKGISGGESKRLAFATEILNKPALIFCDEPTSGLDSYMARNLAKLLKRYAGQGRTIVCTIHQPSSETFELFDHVCVMAEGRCVFIGQTNECMETFVRAGMPCPNNYNPSDHYIFQLAVVHGHEAESRLKVGSLAAAFETSEPFRLMQEEIRDLMDAPTSAAFRQNLMDTKGLFKTFFKDIFNQASQLIMRQCIATVRNPDTFGIRFMVTISMMLLIGSTWLKINLSRYSALQNVPGAIFYLTTFVSFNATMLLIAVIPGDVAVVQRDYLSGVYKIPTYYFSIAAFYTVEVLVSAIIITTGVFWMIFGWSSLGTSEIYAGVLKTCILVALVSVAMGLFISSVSSSFHMANALATPLVTMFMLFSGFLIITNDIPVWFKWIHYTSLWYYAMEMQMVYLYRNQPAPCKLNVDNAVVKAAAILKQSSSIVVDHQSKEKVKNLLLSTFAPNTTAACGNYNSGHQMLEHFNFCEDNLNRDTLLLLLIGTVFHVLGFSIFTLKMWLKRK